MRKSLLWLAMVFVLLVCVPAAAEIYVFDDLYASMEVPDSYVVLTEQNMSGYDSWLRARGSSMEDAMNDFAKRGVLLQAWSEEGDACFELRARKDERSQLLFDVNEQTSEVRGQYRTSHYPDNEYEGYEFSTSEWKNTEQGRFLVLRYARRESGEILYRGFMRRTIRNGYEIDFDMQIHGRSTTNKDNTNLNKIWETFKFIEVLTLPPAAASKINITDAPPQESNEQSFDIKGTASEGVVLTAVTMGLSYPEPVVNTVEVGKNGKFSLPIHLPREGVFLITITGEYEGEEVVELAYPVTYQRTLLAVNFTKKPDAVLKEEKTTIAGTAEPGASIQVIVDGSKEFTKRVTTAGKFSFEVDIEEEDQHEISLVFSKNGLADRRFSLQFSRKWSDKDMMKYLSKQAVSPTYSALKNNIQKYEGRIVGYRAYIMDVSQSGAEYIIKMAVTKKNGKFSNYILVTSEAAPSFETGERVMMYGTCEGMSLSTGTAEDDEQEASYPCFDLLLFASLE